MTGARHRRRSAAAALAVALLGGCALPEEELGATVEPIAEAKPGGRITVAVPALGTLDPAAASDPAAQLVVTTMCDTLVTIDPATGDPRPGLAESWVVADGGRSILFKLRKQARFSDGSRLTSKEVVASLRRLADPLTASPVASLLSDVAGYAALASSSTEDPRTLLRGVRAIEPLSFEVVFENGKHPDFVRALSHPATAPVRADVADRAPTEFAASPVCAGPYKLAAPMATGSGVVRLVRVVDRAHAVDGLTRRGAGYADEVEFRILPDGRAAYEAWRRHEVDIAAVPPDRVAEAQAEAPQAVTVGPDPMVEFIAVPAGERSPFPDRASRRLLADVLDRQAIARDVFTGSRAPATGFLPPSLGSVSRPDACGFGRPLSGPRPPLPTEPVTLTFNDEFRYRAMAEAVARQWREKLGLDVQLVPLGWDEFASKASLGEGLDGLFRMSWSPRYPSGLEYLGPLFLSSNGGSSNLARYSDGTFDRTFDLRVAGAVDERERDLELRRLEDHLCEEVPIIPIAFGQAAVAVRIERVGSARADKRLLTPAGAPLLREVYVR